jgi:hypothetical protein
VNRELRIRIEYAGLEEQGWENVFLKDDVINEASRTLLDRAIQELLTGVSRLLAFKDDRTSVRRTGLLPRSPADIFEIGIRNGRQFLTSDADYGFGDPAYYRLSGRDVAVAGEGRPADAIAIPIFPVSSPYSLEHIVVSVLADCHECVRCV